MNTTLTGVQETLLWTLYNRATESKKRNGVIKDPKAEEIFNQIDYPYRKKFGKASNLFHPVRSLIFDEEIEKFIRKNPTGVIVNLGEGLETHRFRVKSNNNLWYTVDLEDAIAFREKFISPDNRHVHLACSALDISWIHQLNPNTPVFIGAQGLFMYFKEKEVKKLIQDISSYFKQATVMFDVINTRFSKQTMQGYRITAHYIAPKMPWGIQRKEIQETFLSWSHRIKAVEEIEFYFPKGLQKLFFYLIYRLSLTRDSAPVIVKLEIA